MKYLFSFFLWMFIFFGFLSGNDTAFARTLVKIRPKPSPSLAACHRVHDNDHSGDDGIQPKMNALEQKLEECIKRVMNAELDKRLLPLKKANPTVYQVEMKLQAAFNQASDKFSSAFSEACDGSACGMCTPKSGLFEMRVAQTMLSEQNDLVIPAETIKLESVKETHRKKIEAKLKPYFDAFIDQYCKLPSDIWKSKSSPKDCPTSELTEITEHLQYFFAVSEDDDSDVCSAFKVYEPN